MLSVSFGSVAANQTNSDAQAASEDLQTTSQDQSTDTQTTGVEQTPEETASENNQTDENTTENGTDNQTENDTEMSDDERADITTAISSGYSKLNDAESLRFIVEITQANTNGQYDELLNILTDDSSSTEDIIDALNNLSAEDLDNLADIFEFCHDDYQSVSSRARANKTIILMDDIFAMDANTSENFIDVVNFFNDGRFDQILSILNESDTHTVLELYQALNQLSDEDFEVFFNFMQLLDENSQNDAVDVISAISNIPDTINKMVNGDSNGQSSVNTHSKVANYKNQKISTGDKDSISFSKLVIIKELLLKYFDGEITFDQLVQLLNDEGIDTSELKQNPDGTISWFGIDSIIGQDIAVEDNTNSTADTNSTVDTDSTADDDSSATDDTQSSDSADETTNDEPVVDESGV